MRDRFYIVRDHALLQYTTNNKTCPTKVTPLKGLYISKFCLKVNFLEYYGVRIKCETKQVNIKVYHKNPKRIDEWYQVLKQQAKAKYFHEKYHLGSELGKGAFSEVNKCTNIETGEVCAVKIITKGFNKKDEQYNYLEEV